MDDAFDLQVVIAAGPSEVTRATLGFAFALGAAASGQDVVVFLTMDAAIWADPVTDEIVLAGLAISAGRTADTSTVTF